MRTKIGNFKGPKGDKGDQGATGPVGPEGKQGPVGPAGGVNSVNGVQGDVQIGGVNLYTGTKDFGGTGWVNKDTWSIGDDTYLGLSIAKSKTRWSGLSPTIEAKAGEKYVLSGYVRAHGDAVVHVEFSSSMETFTSPSNINISNVVGDAFVRVSVSFSVIADGELRPRFENESPYANETDNYIEVCGLKLERGTVATDWSPAPEDKANADKVVASINGVQGDVVVGGRNLCSGSDTINGGKLSWREGTTADGTFLGLKVLHNEYSGEPISGLSYKDLCVYNGISSMVVADSEYTLSFYAKGRGQIHSYWFPNIVKSLSVTNGTMLSLDDGHVAFDLKNEWQRFSVTYHTIDNINHDTNLICARFAEAGELWICGVKFERGTVATDWSPAPEDKADQSALEAALKRIEALEERLNVSADSVSDNAVGAASLGRLSTDEGAE